MRGISVLQHLRNHEDENMADVPQRLFNAMVIIFGLLCLALSGVFVQLYRRFAYFKVSL